MHWIGIDMSKASFHAAVNGSSVEVFANTPEGIEQFMGALGTYECIPEDTTIGVEATGVYHLLYSRLLTTEGWKVMVINPMLSHRVINSSLRRVKTDRHDAQSIREATRMGFGYRFSDTPDVLALKALVTERAALAKMRGQVKTMAHSHHTRQEAAGMLLHDSFATMLATLSSEIAIIERKMDTYETDTQKLLRTIPGVGRTTAALLVAYIGDIKRFANPEKLTAYIGLDCRVHESGTSIKGKGYLTKRGNTYLRHVLFMGAFVAAQKNLKLKAYFEKKRAEGKHYHSALCAVERKLVHLIYAVWSRHTPFESR